MASPLLEYDGIDKHLKLFDADGGLVFMCDARNDSVADNAWRPDAGCPPGTFDVGAPEANTDAADEISMGPWFIPLYNIPGHDGIGIHGGGSCVYPHSMDPHQGWCPTLNCIRLQNADLEALAPKIKLPLQIKVVQP